MAYAAEQLDRDLGLRAMASVLVRAKIHAHTDNNFWMTVDGDLESGGVFIATHKTLARGTLVLVHMRLGAATDVLEAVATVRWTRSVRAGGPPGIGLQFLDIDDVAMARVRRFMHHVRDPILYDD
jgi:uncharacterized protein (TIGR02266 family)